jgi:hypothetical protein
VNTPFDIEVLDEERVNQRIAASSPFWFVRKTPFVPQPVIIKPVQAQKPFVQQPLVKQTVLQSPVVQVVVEDHLPVVDLDAQVANPLDLNTNVVGKINDLYKNLKREVKASEVKTPESKPSSRKKKSAK